MSALRQATAYLRTLPAAVSGSQGHAATFRAACVAVHGFDLGRQDALEALKDYNLHCKPEWSEMELEHKIDGALKTTDVRGRGYLLSRTARSGEGVVLRRTAIGRKQSPVAAMDEAPSVAIPEWVAADATMVRLLAQGSTMDDAFEVVERMAIHAECAGEDHFEAQKISNYSR